MKVRAKLVDALRLTGFMRYKAWFGSKTYQDKSAKRQSDDRDERRYRPPKKAKTT
jgi:hypothetical protein